MTASANPELVGYQQNCVFIVYYISVNESLFHCQGGKIFDWLFASWLLESDTHNFYFCSAPNWSAWRKEKLHIFYYCSFAWLVDSFTKIFIISFTSKVNTWFLTVFHLCSLVRSPPASRFLSFDFMAISFPPIFILG